MWGWELKGIIVLRLKAKMEESSIQIFPISKFPPTEELWMSKEYKIEGRYNWRGSPYQMNTCVADGIPFV